MINLLPYHEKKTIEHIRTLRVVSVTFGIIILLSIAAALLLLPTLITINSRYDIAQAQITLLEQEGVVTSAVDIASLDARTTKLTEKLAANLETPPTSYIELVEDAAGTTIVLSGFSYTQGEEPILEVVGVASTREALQTFVALLEQKEGIQQVDSPIGNYVKSKNADFTIHITFKK